MKFQSLKIAGDSSVTKVSSARNRDVTFASLSTGTYSVSFEFRALAIDDVTTHPTTRELTLARNGRET
jgi:hypothetical protein